MIDVIPLPRLALTRCREDDSKWPQKNKDGRQELEIRVGNEHIAFEVGQPEPDEMRILTLIIDGQDWITSRCD